MEHDDRVRRLNILLCALPVQAEIGDTESQLDQWECSLVRAAAEITGLTAEMCQQEADTGYVYDAHATAALRRYAKLAK